MCGGIEYSVSLLQYYIIYSVCIEWEIEQQSIRTDPFVFLLWEGPLGPSSPYEKDAPSPTWLLLVFLFFVLVVVVFSLPSKDCILNCP